MAKGLQLIGVCTFLGCMQLMKMMLGDLWTMKIFLLMMLSSFGPIIWCQGNRLADEQKARPRREDGRA